MHYNCITMHVHFMGIGGSGMTGVAEIAKAYGFEVSGCDLKTGGHDVAHLQNVDILAVTPAVFYQSVGHPELVEGQKRNIAMTWQKFMGQYLHKDKFVICVAGTHGKSTTTTLAGLLLEQAKLDPTVEVGAEVPTWHAHHRIGKSKYFISEADEFYDNFLNYHPDVIILNNVEMDHPEYFHTIENVLATYQKFVDQLKPGGTLIYNTDSLLVHKLKLPKKSIPYSKNEFPKDLKLGIAGEHNKANAMGIIKLAEVLKIDYKKTLENFTGIARRMELIGKKNNIKVYDDYANHPTAFAATIAGIKELNPNAKIWAVIEPHTFSRLRTLLSELPDSLKQADQVIISKIFASREQDPGDFSGADIAKAIGSKAIYISEFPDIIKYLTLNISHSSVVLVMGSGNSNKLAREILQQI